MRAFTRLLERLEDAGTAAAKITALEAYFREVPAADAAHALEFLWRGRVRRVVDPASIRAWVAAEAGGLPAWLVAECERHVGDTAETLALLLPPNPAPDPLPLSVLVETRLTRLAGAPPETQHELVLRTWSELDPAQRMVWHRLLAGGPGECVPRALVVHALAGVAGVAPAVMACRLNQPWGPRPRDLARILAPGSPAESHVCPYPFPQRLALDGSPAALGSATSWHVGWLWAGTRAQLLRRRGEVLLWSGEGDLLNAACPEVVEAARGLPDGTVLDGLLLVWRPGEAGPLPETDLRRRLGCLRPSAGLRNRLPMVFAAEDLLELDGIDWRPQAFAKRLEALEGLLRRNTGYGSAPAVGDRPPRQGELFGSAAEAPLPGAPAIRLCPRLEADTWEAVEDLRRAARSAGAAGLTLRYREAPGHGAPMTSCWLEWKTPELTCAGVLVAVRTGGTSPGAESTALTFAVWRGGELVPVATARGELPPDQAGALAAFVRAETTGRFGPVRSVRPVLVFELAFEGVIRSGRHKAGLVLNAARVRRWYRDRRPGEADTLESLQRTAAAGIP